VHIDGFPALVCHSLIVGGSAEAPATGRPADLLQAAYLGSEAAIRLLREGKSASDVRQVIKAICKDHDVAPIEGMMSHGIGKDSLALDNLTIIVAPTEIQAKGMQDPAFAPFQVWCIDVAVSLGKGRVQSIPPSTIPCNIYAKNPDVTYALRLKSSRALLSSAQSRFGSMAFHMRSLEDPTRARMALQECVGHQVVQAYEAQGEKEVTDLTARFMFTVAVMPAGPLRFTDPCYNPALLDSKMTVSSPDIKALLDAPIRPKKK